MPISRKEKKKTEKQKKFKRSSLGMRTLRTLLLGALLMGIVTFAVGIGLYTSALLGEYETEAFMLAQGAAKTGKENVEIERLTKEVMDIYRSIPEEERLAIGTKAYRSHFKKVEEDYDYYIFRTVLAWYKEYSKDIADVYYGVYDSETQALVYVADPATEKGMVRKPGDWEFLEKKELDKFLGWNGEGKLFDISDTSEYGWMCTAGTPIRDKKGNIIGFVLTDILLDKVFGRMGYFIASYLIAVLGVVLIFSVLVLRYFGKTLVGPINEISNAALQYTDAKNDDVIRERYFNKLEIQTGDEIENLSETMKEMENEISDFVDRLTVITAEKERINTELDVASNIQSRMLPHKFPLFPDRKEFDVYASMVPAKEVGGDFYDIFAIDKNHLVMVIADVSGKGIPASLFMMAAKIMIKDYADMDTPSPAVIMKNVNEGLNAYSDVEMFVTVWLGILEISTGKLTAANAGHEYPVILRANKTIPAEDQKTACEEGQPGKFGLYKDKHGFVLGGMTGINYKEYVIQLEPGDIIFEYTDGVTEAVNDLNEMFGVQRMLDSLNRTYEEALSGSPETPADDTAMIPEDSTEGTVSSKDLIENLYEDINDFAESAPQFDDITMLCMRYNGPDGEKGDDAMESSRHLDMTARLDKLPDVISCLDDLLGEYGCPMKKQIELDIAVEEIFVNIARYAYAPEEGKVVIDMAIGDGVVSITFTDQGMPYDPLAKPDPDTTLSARERQIGGLGIFIVKETMDEVLYEYKDESNILTLKKKIE